MAVKVEVKTGRVPAPTLGVNARDPQGAIRDAEAILLENWFPEGDKVRVREGYSGHTSVGSSPVRSIMEWRGPTGVSILVASGNRIYDATVAGTATELTTTALSSDKFQWACFNDRLIMVNGADAPLSFDGSSLSTAGFTATSLTASNLIFVAPFKSRLYFVEKDSASVWYGAAAGVTGALVEFDAGQVAQRGGNVAAVGAWSNDSGEGLDDYLAILMESGEVLIYGGDYPGDSGWALQGSYMLAPPIGRRCTVKFGGELVVLTKAGPLPVSQAMRGVSTQDADLDETWGRVRWKMSDLAEQYGSVEGWQAVNHNGVGFFNVPTVADTVSEQWVLNTTIPAWCSFTGLNVQCMLSSDGDLYFGGPSGGVYTYGGSSDNGAAIVARAKTAFVNFKMPSKMKRVAMLRPFLDIDGSLQCSIGVDVDYSNRTFASNLQRFTVTSTGGLWDTSSWDETDWGDEDAGATNWISAGGIGRQVSIRFEVSILGSKCYWYATDIRMHLGDYR